MLEVGPNTSLKVRARPLFIRLVVVKTAVSVLKSDVCLARPELDPIELEKGLARPLVCAEEDDTESLSDLNNELCSDTAVFAVIESSRVRT